MHLRPRGAGPQRRACPDPGPNARAVPDPVGFPEASGPIDGCQRSGAGSDTVARHDVNLDAGLLQRPKRTGVVGAMRTGPAQHESRTTLR
jgi:hypothetical protein